MQHYESCAQQFPSVLHLLFDFFVMSSFPTSPLYKKHGAFSDFVPILHEQKDKKIPSSWAWVWTILNLILKQDWGAQMLFFHLVFCPRAILTHAPLYLMPSHHCCLLSHMWELWNMYLDCQFNCVANWLFWMDVNCYATIRFHVSYILMVYILNVSMHINVLFKFLACITYTHLKIKIFIVHFKQNTQSRIWFGFKCNTQILVSFLNRLSRCSVRLHCSQRRLLSGLLASMSPQ